MAIKKPVITAEEAAAMVKDGDTIMVSGFWAVGTAEDIMDTLVAQGTKNLTTSSISHALATKGVGKLHANRQVKKSIASFIGRHQSAIEQYLNGELEVEFVPQGTVAERCRAGAFGLGGVLTPTGVGSELAEGKQVINVDGKDYLLETALKADVAIIKAHIADEYGNLRYRYAARNTNPNMAGAAKVTIAQVDKIVPIGEIGPDDVHTPDIFVDYLVVKKQ